MCSPLFKSLLSIAFLLMSRYPEAYNDQWDRAQIIRTLIGIRGQVRAPARSRIHANPPRTKKKQLQVIQ